MEGALQFERQNVVAPSRQGAVRFAPVGAGVELERSSQERRLDVVVPKHDLGRERRKIADRAGARHDQAVRPQEALSHARAATKARLLERLAARLSLFGRRFPRERRDQRFPEVHRRVRLQEPHANDIRQRR